MIDKLLLVDVYNLIFREFYVGTISVYTCLKKIKQFANEVKAKQIILIADSGKKTWRHALYTEYKDHRAPTPSELIEQLQLAPTCAASLGLKWVTIPGWEADDIIATIATQALESVIIVAADKDLLQLLEYEHIVIWDNIKKQFLNSDFVFKKYGIIPKLFKNYLALVGDKSDNILGVPGIGPKTAVKLLTNNTFEEILELIKPEYVEQAKLSQKLVTLCLNVPIDNSILDILKVNIQQTQVEQQILFNEPWIVYFNGMIANDKYFAECKIQEIPKNIKVILINIKLGIEFQLNYESINLISKLVNGDIREFRDIFELVDYWISLSEELPKIPSYFLFEKKIEQILINMENQGLLIDLEYLDQMHEEKLKNLQSIERSIYNLAKIKFLITSPKQVAEVLNTLGITSSKQTNEETLQQINHPLASLILEYRKVYKIISTYLIPVKKYIQDGVIHTTFDNNFANTGRIISRNPNMQNLPKNSETRKLIIARSGYCFIGADYNQMELRVLAELANVEILKQAFLDNLDMHKVTAEKLFGSSTHENRLIAKTINFGILYGISSFGLASTLQISQERAAQIIKDYYTVFSGIKEYQAQIIEHAKRFGYVTTYWGRRCYVNTGPESRRQAINAPIQGTAAEIIKYAMLKLDYLVLQVHDEILAEVPENEVKEYVIHLKKTMEQIDKFYLPITVKIGKNWGEMNEI